MESQSLCGQTALFFCDYVSLVFLLFAHPFITSLPVWSCHNNCWHVYNTAAAATVQILSSNLQESKQAAIPNQKLFCERNGGQTILPFEAKMHSTVWSNSQPETPLKLWNCFGTQDELTLPAKWTVNIILEVISLLLYRQLKDFSPASFREVLDLNHTQSLSATDSYGP